MEAWDRFLSEDDKKIRDAAGYGSRQGFGSRPAVLVIDVNYNFCGDAPRPILESVTRWRNSCGPAAWAAAEQIAVLLEAARNQHVPIIYSTGEEPREDPFYRGRWLDKNPRGTEDSRSPAGQEIISLIAPHASDIVIRKAKPSVFFGTMLSAYLVDLGVDSLIVCGTTTSGCVRATVLDAFSLNYKVAVVAECTFDRFETSHWVSLFDMDAKYSDVISVDDAITFVSGLDGHLFAADRPALERAE